MMASIEKLLPHRAPMRWVEELLECTATTATARIRFTRDHYAVTDGIPLETALVECMAQTVAAALGYRLQQSGDTNQSNHGMLAAVSNFKLISAVPLDQDLLVDVIEVKRLGPMLMVTGKVIDGEAVIATGDLSLYA